VRRLFWPAGDFTLWGTPPEDYPPGYFGSVRWGVLARLVLVYGVLLFGLMLAVAFAASVLT